MHEYAQAATALQHWADLCNAQAQEGWEVVSCQPVTLTQQQSVLAPGAGPMQLAGVVVLFRRPAVRPDDVAAAMAPVLMLQEAA